MTARFILMVVIVVKCGVGMHIGDVLAIAGADVITLLLQVRIYQMRSTERPLPFS